MSWSGLQANSALTDQRYMTLTGRERLTLLIDLDGTLIPFAAPAEDATLDDVAVEVIGALHSAGVQVVISILLSRTSTRGRRLDLRDTRGEVFP